MMLNLISSALFTLLAVVSAVPNVLEARASCNADNCLRAIRASSAKPGSASASSDCVSFFKKTVTPCVVTISTTVIVSTDIPTVTTTLSLTATVSADSTTTLTVIVPTTVFVDAPQFKARGVLYAARAIEARNAAPAAPAAAAPVVTCNPVRSPTAVPTYASACSGTVRYSSACSCIAVTQSTTTLVPVSTTTTFTSTTTTVSITPTFTVSTTVSTVTTGGTVTATTTVTSTITSTCPTAQPKVCNGQCKNLNSDKNNCGACGNVCPASQNSCSAGQCRKPNACDPIFSFCGTGLSCVCYRTTENQGYCAVNGGSCGTAYCNSSSDCGDGLACLTDCGRNGSRGTCTYGADQNVCGNAAAKVKRWLESGKKRDEAGGTGTGPFRPLITATQ